MPQFSDSYLLQIVEKACSQVPANVKEAEARIQELETQHGYSIGLLGIIMNYNNIDTVTRCMACVCLKNVIDKYWRKSAQNSIRDDERTMLKSQFLQYLNEPELKIARQMSVILGKLARFELPNQWPELVPNLLNIIQETSANNQQQQQQQQQTKQTYLVQSRCLMALHQIIKSLASKRLANDRKVFEELAHNIMPLLLQFGFFFVEKCLLSSIGNADCSINFECNKTQPEIVFQLQEKSFIIDQAIICIKIMHKLILHGFRDNVENVTLNQLMINLLKSTDKLLAKLSFIVNSGQQVLVDYFKEKYEYLLVLYVELMLDYQENYPYSFVDTCMSDCLNMIIQICFTPQGKSLSFPKLSINLMNFMKSIIMCDKYKPRLIKIDDPTLQLKQQKAIEIKQSFFTRENLQQMLGFLFNEYLLMTIDELELWENSPEEFVNEDGTSTDAWKYNHRACAETLFQAFVHEYNELVVPIVVELVQVYSKVKCDVATSGDLQQQQQQFQLSSIDRNILLKEASYNCASIAAWELVTHIDFNSWFTQTLLNETQTSHLLIRRRILILISIWVGIKMSSENRVIAYELLCKCMQSNEDMVIRLQSALALKAMIDDIHFERDLYLPFLNFHFGLLCQLLKEAEESDTKIKVLGVISCLIERVDVHIRPCSAQLADYLPFLWEQSAEHNILRCSILTAFHNLIKSLGAQSINYHPFLLPVIHYSTNLDNPASLYLLEDGLELWIITVQNSLTMSDDLLKLFNNIKVLLDRDTDIWKLCLEIIDSYVVLDAVKLFQFYGDFIVNKCCDLLNESIKIDALLRLMRTISLMFEVPANNIQITLFEPFILKAMNLVLNTEVYPMTMAICLSTLTRPVLECTPQFIKIVEKNSEITGVSPEKLLGNLLDSWIDKMDMIVLSERRKLAALALISLLRLNSHVIYERFSEIVNISIMVMQDILKDENGTKQDCLLVSRDIENDDEDVDTEHEKRKRRLRLVDPVYTVSIKSFCLEKLRECESQLGTVQFQQLMASIDQSTLQQLNELLNT